MSTTTAPKARTKPRPLASIQKDIERLEDEKENALAFNEFKNGRCLSNEDFFKKLRRRYGGQ